MRINSKAVSLAAVATVGLLVAGCAPSAPAGSADGQGPVSQDEIDAAMSTPTDLTFWTWVPDIEDEVALFEAKYPEINVTVENVGSGGEHYQKVRTALQSGEGAPDVIQVEYQFIPSFVLTDSLLDLAPYGADDLEGDYIPWVWKQVESDGQVWSIPQDTGPMGTLYRSDIFEQAGLDSAPATYDEFAEAAAQVKEATGSYITNLPTNDAAQVVGLLWQAGAKPFGYDGDKGVTIDVNSDAAKDVMRYWQDLIERDLVAAEPAWNDAYYQSLANGRFASWLTGAWAPTFLQGTVQQTAGNWRAAPLPQWSADTQVAGNVGGSSNAVLSSSENPIAAYELAKFINHDETSTLQLNTEQSLFPAATSVLEAPAFADAGSDFFGGQKVNAEFAEIAATVDTEFQWLPFMDYAYSQFNEVVGAAIGEKGDLSAALDQWQADLEAYATDQGFTVN